MTFREPDAAARFEKLLESESAHSVGYRLRTHGRRGDALRVLETLCARSDGPMRFKVLEVLVSAFPDAPGTRDAMRRALLVEDDWERWFRLMWWLGDMRVTGLEVAIVVLDLLAQVPPGRHPGLPLSAPPPQALPSSPAGVVAQAPSKKGSTWFSRLLGEGKGAKSSTPLPAPRISVGGQRQDLAGRVAGSVSGQLGNRRLTDDQIAILQRFNKRYGQKLGGVGGTPGVALDAAQITSRCQGVEGLTRLRALLQEPEKLRSVTSSCPRFQFKMSPAEFEELWPQVPGYLHTLLGPGLLGVVGDQMDTTSLVALMASTESEVFVLDVVRLLGRLEFGYRVEPALAKRLAALFPNGLRHFREKLWPSFEPGSDEFPRWQARLSCSSLARAAASVLPGERQIALSTASAIAIFDIASGRPVARHEGHDLPLLMLSFAPGRWLAERRNGEICELSLEGPNPQVFDVEGGKGWNLQAGDWVTGQGDEITAERENQSYPEAKDTVAQIRLRRAFTRGEEPNLAHFRVATGGYYGQAGGPRFDTRRRIIWGPWHRRLAIDSTLDKEGDEETTLWISSRSGPLIVALEQVTSEEVCLHVWAE